MLLPRLSKIFVQGATMPHLHPKFMVPPCQTYTHTFELSLLWEGGIMLPLRLSQRLFSGCHHANPKHTKKFLELSLLWEGALCFCFDLAKVFLQGGTMPHLSRKKIFGFVIIVERGIMLLLRPGQGISLG